MTDVPDRRDQKQIIMKKTTGYAAAAAALAFAGCAGPGQEMFGDRPLSEVLDALTLEQKVNIVVGGVRGADNPPYPAPGMPVRGSDGVTANLASGRVKGASAYGYSVDSLGIPVVTYSDGPAGVRIDPVREGDTLTYYCTAFPTGSSLAASWDTAAVRAIASAIGNEAREYGVDVLLAPGINIQRNPLCGRNFEYYSEDPVLAGAIGSAYVDGVQSNNVGVSVKHFAVNNQETLRNGLDVSVSERAMREIYFRPFEYIVRNSSPWTIMSSYNKINGVLASENKWLLTDVLRGEWGYDGVVITDWWAEENGARQQAAGNDLLMPGSQHQYDEVFEGLENGTLTEAELDRNVANILRLTARTNAFAGYRYSDRPDLDAHAMTAREYGSAGMVLLENDGVLPLDAGVTVALFGNAAYDTFVGGTGSGNVNRRYKVNIDEGLEDTGYSLYEPVAAAYREYTVSKLAEMGGGNFWWMPDVPEMPLDGKSVSDALEKSDVAVFVLGRMAGEGTDRLLAEGDYYLDRTERENMSAIVRAAHSQGKKAVLLLNMGGMVDLEDCPRFDAVLHVWLPGQEAGHCAADVVSGKVNPSGRLPMTWVAEYDDYPSSGDFPLSDGSDRQVVYSEDIYVGYRHFEKSGIKPLYPFGYGLSYTSFGYDGLEIRRRGGTYTASLTVTNTGQTAGREVVQLYVSTPGTLEDRPLKELKAFCKTPVLRPGESCMADMSFLMDDLAVWKDGGWHVEKGEYKVYAGSSSSDIRLTGTFRVR